MVRPDSQQESLVPRRGCVSAKRQLVEQPAIGLFAELGWQLCRTRNRLLPLLLSGQVNLNTN